MGGGFWHFSHNAEKSRNFISVLEILRIICLPVRTIFAAISITLLRTVVAYAVMDTTSHKISSFIVWNKKNDITIQ